MSAKCPLCGSHIAGATLMVDLNTNTASRLGHVARLCPQEAELLWAIYNRAPETMQRERCLTALYGGRDEPASANFVLGKVMHGLRRKVAPLGVRVVTVHSVGYRLALEDIEVDLEPPRHWKLDAVRVAA